MNWKTPALAAVLCGSALAVSAAVPKDATYLRLGAMPQPPVIDGKIDYNEWRYASTSFGGISPKTGVMTLRENDFRFGYDAKNLYFAITSEMPFLPQTLTPDDKVEFRIVAPNGKKAVIIIDAEGKGSIPGGVTFQSGFAPALLNRFRNKCWTIEVAVPLATFGVDKITDGKEWKLQMARHWSSDPETGYWHYTPKGKGNEYGTFIPDAAAPVASFDGFGHHGYEATGNYQWTFRVENSGSAARKIHSECRMFGISGVPTLDINNPDLVGEMREFRIGLPNTYGGNYDTVAEPGKSAFFQLYLMAQFDGVSRLLVGNISDAKTKTLYYQRSFFWDVAKASKSARYQDKRGLPYLSAGFYPSFGNKLRYAATFEPKLPVMNVRFEVKDSKGKVLWQKFKSGYGNPLESFEEETSLPGLPLGDYSVTMTSTGADGKKYAHTRTFSLRKFAWQNQNIGKERVIIPPFKPLQLDKNAKTVKALLTGYKLGGNGLWSEIYAEGENILASPVAFYFEGKPIIPGEPKLISAEDDRIVYESRAKVGRVTFIFNQDYDYDGFCKVTVKAIPDGVVLARDFGFTVALKDEVVKFYDGSGKTGNRAGNAPDLTIPAGQGKLDLKGISHAPGNLLCYFWFGGVYKGFSWIIGTTRNCTLEEGRDSWSIARENGAVTFKQDFLMKPVAWCEPQEWVIGFEPTPVKPRNQGYLQMGQYMYDYNPPKGADFASMSNVTTLVPWLDYEFGMIPNDDLSYFKYLFSTRGKIPTEAERKAFAEDYQKRNAEWITRNLPLYDKSNYLRSMTDKRQYGKKYFLHYQLPTLYSYKWDEAEMYKAEWLPWDYPVDDAANEYICCQTTTHNDFLLYQMRKEARLGFDGMNFDTFPLGGGFNTITGNGVRYEGAAAPRISNENMLRTASAGIRGGNNYFGWRELMKRTATMLYVEKKLVYGTPWVDLHSTNTQMIPVAAFCSTLLPWERSSNGGQYFDRFPESFVLADTVGTQSGAVGSPIVSTHSTKLPEKEQVKTLIAHSFAYGIMNHTDQGVTRGYADYQKMRDYVFTFGYGKPQNKTLFFYSKEPQPVKCDIPAVHTTQVIRPDGKTLLMIGNTGKAFKAKFDLVGLKYEGYRISDVFSGLALAEPSVDLDEHGYALLLIENGKPLTAEEIAAHNRRITGYEIRFDKPEQMTFEDPAQAVSGKDGVFHFKGVTHFWSKEAIKVEPGRKYSLFCDFRQTTDAKTARPTLAVIFLEADGSRTPAIRYMAMDRTQTTLASPVKGGDPEAVVKAVKAFAPPGGASAYLVFDVKADESDLPNKNVSPVITKFRREGENIRVTFKTPLTMAFAAGTSVRLHRSGAFYQPVPKQVWYNRMDKEWKPAGGEVPIPAGAKAFRVAVISSGNPPAGMFDARNLRLVVK